MTDRRTILKAGAMLPFLFASTDEVLGQTASPASPFPYGQPIGQYPQPEFIRDALRLHFGSALQVKSKLFDGWDKDIVAYGMAPQPIGKDMLRAFYTAVFEEFPDFRLVDDVMLVAGDMGAHRYHALGTHTGGKSPTHAKIMFRGQTIYRVNSAGYIVWRNSNHDHGFRESQLDYFRQPSAAGPVRSWAPDPFAPSVSVVQLHTPATGMTEHSIRDIFAQMQNAFNQPRKRSDFWRNFSPSAAICGLNHDDPLKPMPLSALVERDQSLRAGLNRFKMWTEELIVCGDHVAHLYRLEGKHSGGAISGKPADGRDIVLREQAVYRFGSDNRIAEMWINHDRRLFEQQFGKGS